MSVGVADEYLVVNATDAVAMYEEIYEATEGQMADVVINVVTLALKFYVNKKLIDVDMIEALKSVD